MALRSPRYCNTTAAKYLYTNSIVLAWNSLNTTLKQHTDNLLSVNDVYL